MTRTEELCAEFVDLRDAFYAVTCGGAPGDSAAIMARTREIARELKQLHPDDPVVDRMLGE